MTKLIAVEENSSSVLEFISSPNGGDKVEVFCGNCRKSLGELFERRAMAEAEHGKEPEVDRAEFLIAVEEAELDGQNKISVKKKEIAKILSLFMKDRGDQPVPCPGCRKNLKVV